MRFTLRQLEVFTAIAADGNVSAAAQQLAMSQSAASTALAELERRAGRPLFDRAGKRLRLNELGRMLVPAALAMLDRAQEIDALLEGRAGPGPLRLGATRTIGNYLAPWLVERYRAAHPGASIALEIGNMSAIAARVAAFEIDVALIEGEYADPDLLIGDWMADELAIFCSPSHPLAAAGTASIDRLLEEEWAVRERGSGTRQTLDRALAPYWSRWRIGIELEHIEAIKATVEAGRMIGCVSRLALTDALASGRLVEIRVAELALSRRFYTVVHRGKYRTAGMAAFLDLCGEAAAVGLSG